MAAEYYTLTRADVDRPVLRAFGRVWLVTNFIGHIHLRDVGKRVYLRDGVLQVENDEQRARRCNVEDQERSREVIQVIRIFDGKRYQFEVQANGEAELKLFRRGFRNRGYSVRSVRAPGVLRSWYIYVRKMDS